MSAVGDAAVMNVLGGMAGGVLRALDGQEAQRTARDLALARENRKGSRLTPEEFVECADDAVELCSAVTAMLRAREIAAMKAAFPEPAEPPPNVSAMSQEEIEAILAAEAAAADKPS